jgi:hypothetical protein
MAALGGGGGLLAGFLGKQAIDNSTSQQSYSTAQQPNSPSYNYNQQNQYQQPQQDMSSEYGYSQADQYQQPVQDQVYQPQSGSDYGTYGYNDSSQQQQYYAEPQQQQQDYYGTSNVDTDATDYTGYDSYGGDSYANEMNDMDNMEYMSGQIAETEAEGGEAVADLS